MINANELRIGNWVHHAAEWSYRNKEQKEFPFQWDDADWYHISTCTLDLENINPIPITPELLHKAGFGFSYSTVYSDGSKTDHYTKSGSFFIRYIEDGKCMYERWTKVSYLHQLQNLYFSITGEELKFTP